MVVDDDIRSVVHELLEDEGHRVLAASNSSEALALLRQGPRPRVVLLDLMMPVMNGWQFLQTVRRQPPLASIPIVVITAAPSSAAGVARPLRKPFDRDALLATIEDLCA
jgi:CheY-like chemotaxis protein